MPGHPSKPSFQCLTFITSLDNLKHLLFQTVIFDCTVTTPFSHFDTTYEEIKISLKVHMLLIGSTIFK